MRITTWNCNMAFRKKAELILSDKPDILVVPECEHPSKLTFCKENSMPSDLLWFGDNRNKGLGIFTFNNLKLRVKKSHNPDLKLIIPITVIGGQMKLNLYAIWANNPNDTDGQYVEQVWKAINQYSKSLSRKNTVLIGDFNSNTIWDRKYRQGNHSNVVKFLENKHIFSSYHYFFNQTQGAEKHPTFYLYKHSNKPYHLDYCFLSKDLLEKLEAVEIGKFNKWKPHSDHMPLSVKFKN